MDATAPELGERFANDPAKQSFCEMLHAIVRETGRAPLLASDKDGTLSRPRRPLTPDIAAALLDLASSGVTVAVISGGEAYRLREEVFDPLHARIITDAPRDFYLVAENGAQTYKIEGDALVLVDRADLRESIGAERFATVLAIVEETRKKFGIGDDPQRRHVVFEGSQIKLSGLGNLNDDAVRHSFDPDGAKRSLWAEHVRTRLLEEGLSDEQGLIVNVIVSGTSSINLLARGVNKGHAIDRLAQRSGADRRSVVYFGDNFAAGGNDIWALASVRAAVNFGADVRSDALAARVINAGEKGPEGARQYLELARETLARYVAGLA